MTHLIELLALMSKVLHPTYRNSNASNSIYWVITRDDLKIVSIFDDMNTLSDAYVCASIFKDYLPLFTYYLPPGKKKYFVHKRKTFFTLKVDGTFASGNFEPKKTQPGNRTC